MINKYGYILLFFLFFLQSNRCISQKLDNGDIVNLYTLVLPPLQELIDSAYVNSPLIRGQELLANQQNFVIKNEQVSWLKALALTSNYNYGTNITNINGNAIQTYSTTATNWYGVGLSLSLPLSVVLNKRRNIQIAKIGYEIEKEHVREIKITLNKIISELYINVQLKEKILHLRSKSLQTLEVNYSLASLEFKDNMMDISSFSKIHDLYTTAKISFEKAKSEYEMSTIELEETIGINLR